MKTHLAAVMVRRTIVPEGDGEGLKHLLAADVFVYHAGAPALVVMQ